MKKFKNNFKTYKYEKKNRKKVYIRFKKTEY